MSPATLVRTRSIRSARQVLVDQPGTMDIQVNPVSVLRNVSTIVFIVLTNSFGNLLLAIGTQKLPDFQNSGFPEYLRSVFTTPEIFGGVALLALWMFAQLSMFSWSDLSYVIPVTGSGYIITAVLGIYFLGESVSITRWIGIILVSLGVFFVVETEPRTVHPSGGKAE